MWDRVDGVGRKVCVLSLLTSSPPSLSSLLLLCHLLSASFIRRHSAVTAAIMIVQGTAILMNSSRSKGTYVQPAL